MFRLPEEVKKDIEKYKGSLDELRKGEISPARFKGIRVPWGIYSHRGGKEFMTRIRIPASVVSPPQLSALARASSQYGGGALHITTREDIQIHNVKIENTAVIMDELKGHDLSPRGGGGNTVRNVIACPLSGVCADEVFDVRGHATALTEYLLRRESSFNMPRKFKVAFSGCAKDCTGCLVNDIGLLARLRGAHKGFRVFAGGGMGADSRVGRLLEEFVPEDDIAYCVSAVKNIFYKKGDRRDRHHNRLRFLIEEMGPEEFGRLYRDEFRELKNKEYIVLRKIALPPERTAAGAVIPRADGGEYAEFLKYNVLPQRQEGFLTAGLRIPRGDIPAEKLSALADMERDFPGIEFRTSQDQDLFICWVKNTDAQRLFLRLKEVLKDFLYPGTLIDVVACKGALTCNLGLCNSPAAARELESMIKRGFINTGIFAESGINIRINGCPNACGQHPIGRISLHGLVRRVDGRPVPFYKLLLGGRKGGDKTRLAREAGMVPARNLPDFLRDFLKALDGKLRGGADIDRLLEGPAADIARDILKRYSYVPPYGEKRDFYVDWGRDEDFSLEGLGPGECGAGVLDMIDSDLTDAKLALDEAGKEGCPAQCIKKALFSSARALLVVKGCDPRSEQEAFLDFKREFIDRGVSPEAYSGIGEVFDGLSDGSRPEERREKLSYAKEFFGHINALYGGMDSAFNFPKRENAPPAGEKAGAALDLKGTPCPLNYVKTKLFMENLEAGDILEVLLDEGEPVDNVPKSLENDGHKILRIEKVDGFYRVVVKKR